MFDVGLLELLLVGVVALLVVGPERLPKLARTAGMWLGRGRRFINSVKDDIDREMKADELRQILEKQKQSNPLHEIVDDTKKTFDQIKSDTEAAVNVSDKPKTSDAKHE
ncbi:Sec-independent protein translocase protein TatB [Thiosocius teredinicola]|uniref:Sec-independent protein translocase protein TatB n=1 Tax=Thiosocius teredinicola TaxID=1973002 RepID=UPI000990ED0F